MSIVSVPLSVNAIFESRSDGGSKKAATFNSGWSDQSDIARLHTTNGPDHYPLSDQTFSNCGETTSIFGGWAPGIQASRYVKNDIPYVSAGKQQKLELYDTTYPYGDPTIPYYHYNIYSRHFGELYDTFIIVQIRMKAGAKAAIAAAAPANYHFIGFSFTQGGVAASISQYTKAATGAISNFNDITHSTPNLIQGSGSDVLIVNSENPDPIINSMYESGDESPITLSVDPDMLQTANPDVETTEYQIWDYKFTRSVYTSTVPTGMFALYAPDGWLGDACYTGNVGGEEQETIAKDDIPISEDSSGEVPTSGWGSGVNSISSRLGEDEVDILYIPSNLAQYDANGTYIGDLPYGDFDGLVVGVDGVFYYPTVRMTSITNSLLEPDTMEFTQYAKFDASPIFTEGDLVYGVIEGTVKFGGHVTNITYSLKDSEQLIVYTCVGFRKNFENAPWVFNYTDYNLSASSVLDTILGAAPSLYYRGKDGNIPTQNIPEVDFKNETIGGGLNFIFSSVGKYAWYLGPNKKFSIYNLESLPTEDIYVGQEGVAIGNHNVTELNVNYDLSDRITRLIIRGDFKRDNNNNIIYDEDDKPTYLLYDTGWQGTAYTRFNVQRVKTIIEDKFKYIEGVRNDYNDMQQYANLYLKPFKDAFIGGTCTLDTVNLNLALGKAVNINNTNMSYLNNQDLIIYSVRYNLSDKSTELSLSNNYWFGTDLTNYFLFLENRIDALLREAEKNKFKDGNFFVAMGKVTQLLTATGLSWHRAIVINDETINGGGRRLVVAGSCVFYNCNWSNLTRGSYVYIKYRIIAGMGLPIPGTRTIPTFKAFQVDKLK